MSDKRQEWDEAVRAFWEALADVNPVDRWLIVPAAAVGVITGIRSGLGLLTPFYAALLAALAVAMFWAIRLFARSKL